MISIKKNCEEDKMKKIAFVVPSCRSEKTVEAVAKDTCNEMRQCYYEYEECFNIISIGRRESK